MSHQEPHTHLPQTAYEGRPYDWSMPYDWEIEGDFPNPDAASQEDSYVLSRLAEGWDNLRTGTRVAAAVFAVGAVCAVPVAILGNEGGADALRAQDIPGKLPKPVWRHIASAVKVQDSDGGGSGVKIGPDIVLTAGHVVPQPAAAEGECDSLQVQTTVRAHQYGEGAHAVLNWVGVNNPHGYTRGRDMAVMRVQTDPVFDSLPAAKVAADRPSKGDTVFFINYEEGGPDSHEDHWPYQGWTGRNYFEGNWYDHHAAMYAGTVIGYDGPYIAIATGIAGYGKKVGMELDSHPGASGGEVLNSKGRLIGISVAIQNDPETLAEILKYRDLKLPYPRLRDVSMIQPVTPGILHRYLTALPEDSVC